MVPHLAREPKFNHECTRIDTNSQGLRTRTDGRGVCPAGFVFIGVHSWFRRKSYSRLRSSGLTRTPKLNHRRKQRARRGKGFEKDLTVKKRPAWIGAMSLILRSLRLLLSDRLRCSGLSLKILHLCHFCSISSFRTLDLAARSALVLPSRTGRTYSLFPCPHILSPRLAVSRFDVGGVDRGREHCRPHLQRDLKVVAADLPLLIWHSQEDDAQCLRNCNLQGGDAPC
jgi:hypothetical protein